MSLKALAVVLVCGTAQAQTVLHVDAGTVLQLDRTEQGGADAAPYLRLGAGEWHGYVGDRYTFGFGYHVGNGFQAVEAGEFVEFAGGDEVGAFFIATRPDTSGAMRPVPRMAVFSDGKVRIGTGADGGMPEDDGITGALLQVKGDIASEGYPVVTAIDPHYAGLPQRIQYTNGRIYLNDAGVVTDTFLEPYGLGGGYCFAQYYAVPDDAELKALRYAQVLVGDFATGIIIHGTPGMSVIWICIGAKGD